MEKNPPSYEAGDSGNAVQYPPTQAPYSNQPAYPPTQPGYPPTQPGYPPIVYQGNQTLGQSLNLVGQSLTQAVNQTVVVQSGACPKCGIGSVNKEATCCGLVLAFIFFPLGILCCIAMMEPKCNNCKAKF